MQIELNENKKIYEFNKELDKNELPHGDDLTISYDQPLNIKGRLELLNNDLGWLKFDVSGEAIYPCSRCLDDVRTSIDYNFDEEVPIEDDKVFDLDDYIHDCLYIYEPAQILCQEDCQGLCPVCGTNLNKEQCDCEIEEEEAIDPRLAKLKQLL